MMSVGIKETKELVKFMLGLGNSLDKALDDKKISVMDVPLFMGVFMDMAPAFDGIAKVPAEIKDLSAEEMAELSAFVQQEFDIKSDRTEAIIEGALMLAADIYKYAKLFKKDK
jgi:hypothetical protein